MSETPVLVAHRGYPAKYPENTLISIEAALDAGAQAIEFDVQLSADGVPVLFHDHELARVTGADGLVTKRSFYELRTLRAYEPERFDAQFYDINIASLEDAVKLLTHWPGVEIFVELKSESMDVFGRNSVLTAVTEALQPIATQCVLISFDYEILLSALDVAANTNIHKVGWVLHKYNNESKVKAEKLQPDYLICNMKKTIKTTQLWAGRWQWMLYETDVVSQVQHCIQKGARYIETDNIGELLPKLQAASL